MKPSIKVITLGVLDLEKSLAFYRDALGWATEGIVGTEFEGGAVAFFELNGGLILALYPKTQIAKDANLPANQSSAIEFTLGHNVNSKAEVDAIFEQVKKAGATITDPPRDRAWGGYSGHFQDPDGHLWEVVWNPQLAVE
jgi:catechol 2,3-dioxygenase-like lactoylglutathione lyase family enzyme